MTILLDRIKAPDIVKNVQNNKIKKRFEEKEENEEARVTRTMDTDRRKYRWSSLFLIL
jgi:hypothetical protein